MTWKEWFTILFVGLVGMAIIFGVAYVADWILFR
jgi:preprotein translocase subunit Sss1